MEKKLRIYFNFRDSTGRLNYAENALNNEQANDIMQYIALRVVFFCCFYKCYTVCEIEERYHNKIMLS